MKATSFATRQDLAEFCKLVTNGMSAHEALNFGDNGVGAWQDPCWMPHGPAICALPHPWNHNQQVRVTIPQLNKSVVCIVRDRSPSGVVDLNPAALLAFGLGADDDIAYENATVEAV